MGTVSQANAGADTDVVAPAESVSYDDALTRYDPVLGLEVHVELNTHTKMFCGCRNEFGGDPNTHTCPVCLALPGSLPVVNQTAVESAIRIGLALNCSIADWCRFARKNYFYPDIPKNYQVSQYDEPIAHDGWIEVEVDGHSYTIEIERAHMEEDAGKAVHVGGADGRLRGASHSLMDYNRAGTPLIEIVTKPIEGTGADAPEVARAYVTALRDLMKALDVSDVRMEQGSLRCDANLSLRPTGRSAYGLRTETKNVNSLRSIARALSYETTRQAALLDHGDKVHQETRHFDDQTGTTTSGRSKEQAEDYRYFPEPDLVPVAPSAEWVKQLRETLPEPPATRRKRLMAEWGFSEPEMRDVVAAEALDLIEATVASGSPAQPARKWWLTELARRANDTGVELDSIGMTPAQVARLQQLVDDKTINDKMARQVIDGVLAGEGDPATVVDKRGLAMVSDESALSGAIDEAIAANPDVAEKVAGGKVQAAGALIGSVMKRMRGQADADRVRELILEKLS